MYGVMGSNQGIWLFIFPEIRFLCHGEGRSFFHVHESGEAIQDELVVSIKNLHHDIAI